MNGHTEQKTEETVPPAVAETKETPAAAETKPEEPAPALAVSETKEAENEAEAAPAVVPEEVKEGKSRTCARLENDNELTLSRSCASRNRSDH